MVIAVITLHYIWQDIAIDVPGFLDKPLTFE